MNYFFDSYAIIEIINQNKSYEKFMNHLIITNSLNLGEVYFYLLKIHNKQTADFWINKLNVEIIDISLEDSLKASLFRYENKKKNLSYADCIGYIAALKKGFVFLTGDKQFENLENVEFVK